MRAALLALLLSACAAAPIDRGDPQAPATIVGEGQGPPPGSPDIREVVRADAQRSFGPECGGQVIVPDRAFIPVELTGDDWPEQVVAFGRVDCGGQGWSGPWQGTGGVMIQVWGDGGWPARLFLEHSVHGFALDGRRLVTLQHGAYCPGGAGPAMCRVDYEWNPKDRRLEVVRREFITGEDPAAVPAMQYGYEALSR